MLDRLMLTLKTGHADIDDDHAVLVTPLHDALNVVKQSGDAAAASGHLDRFVHMCEGHFRREERILTEAGYPDVDTHAAYHHHILCKIREARTCFIDATTWDERFACVEKLLGLIVDDIVKGDMAFVSFLQDKGLARERV